MIEDLLNNWENMPLKTPNENTKIIEIIHEMYEWWPETELDYETPFQFLCAVILSAQATDKQVNRLTPILFARIKEPRDMFEITLEEVAEYVRSINYFNSKAKYIYESGKMLVENFWGIIPNDLGQIQKLPGVGIKTAKVVLSVLYRMPYVGVDTHVHRVCNRIGIVREKTPELTDKAIVRRLTVEQKQNMHHPFVLFGRYHCTARNPKCTICKVAPWCNYLKKKFGEKRLQDN